MRTDRPDPNWTSPNDNGLAGPAAVAAPAPEAGEDGFVALS
jgi:hypothetical protein